MPACWPTVVWRSTGLIRVAIGRDDRRLPSALPCPRPRRVFRASALFDDPSPLHRLPRFVAALGRSTEIWIKREDLLPIGVRRQQAAQPRDPRGRGARGGRGHARHLRPPLVQPLPADRGGRRADRSWRPRRPVRAARSRRPDPVSDSTSCSGRRSTRPRRPTGRSARGSSTGGGRATGGSAAARTSSTSAAPGAVGATGPVACGRGGLRAGGRGRAPARRHRPPVGHGRDPGRAPRRSAVGAPDLASSASSSPDRRPSSAGDRVDGRGAGEPGRARRRPSPPTRRAPSSSTSPSWVPATVGGPRRPTRRPSCWHAREGILVDPIYTAKALAGLVAGARAGELDGRTVLFWHAGGTPGLFEPLD